MANDVHRLVIAFTAGGQFFENVLAFQANVTVSTTPEADSSALIAAFIGTMETPLMACLSVDTTLLAYKAKRLNNTGGPSTILPRSGVVGTFGTEPCSNTRVAAGLSYDYYNVSGTPPRWRVGKQFLGAIGDTAMDSNSWSPTFITAALAYATALGQDASSTPGPWVTGIWSDKYDFFFIGTSWELLPEICALKRRIKPYI
jgi:hypothetical protein